MRKLVVILDPAHGRNTPGKCSPDGQHREYLWSRMLVDRVRIILQERGFCVQQTTMSINEPGLSVRKKAAEKIKGDLKLLVSLHNNAAGSDEKWHKATGFEVWTTVNVTNSDICADYFIEQLRKDFPKVACRLNSPGYLNKDKEANFTVLTGKGYMAVLVEWLFQDNKKDVVLLQSDEMNNRFAESICSAIEDIDVHFSRKQL